MLERARLWYSFETVNYKRQPTPHVACVVVKTLNNSVPAFIYSCLSGELQSSRMKFLTQFARHTGDMGAVIMWSGRPWFV